MRVVRLLRLLQKYQKKRDLKEKSQKKKFDQEYWSLCVEVLENFRLKNVGFEVMLSKVNKLKSASFRISKSAVLYQDVETIYDENLDECVVKKIIKY